MPVLLGEAYGFFDGLVEVECLLDHAVIAVVVFLLVYACSLDHQEESLIRLCGEVFEGQPCRAGEIVSSLAGGYGLGKIQQPVAAQRLFCVFMGEDYVEFVLKSLPGLEFEFLEGLFRACRSKAEHAFRQVGPDRLACAARTLVGEERRRSGTAHVVGRDNSADIAEPCKFLGKVLQHAEVGSYPEIAVVGLDARGVGRARCRRVRGGVVRRLCTDIAHGLQVRHREFPSVGIHRRIDRAAAHSVSYHEYDIADFRSAAVIHERRRI